MMRIATTISAGALVVGLSAWATAASSEPAQKADRAQYRILQSISYEFGTKFTSGYFVRRTGKCHVNLMLADKSDPEQPSPQKPARVRVILNPGQMLGLDSEEGKSLNFTCGSDAAALLVDAGERDRLTALQNNALFEAVAANGE